MSFGKLKQIKLNTKLKGVSLWPLFMVLIMGIIGAVLIGYSTSWGPWVFSDSTVYITVARNFIEGRGFGLVNPSGVFRPLYHYPPLYPLILSGLSIPGMDVLDAARLLNIILYAFFIVVIGSTLYYTTKSTWVMVIYTSTIILLPELLNIFSGAMSEPLSIFLGFTGLILLVLYIDKKGKYLLYCSALLISLASLTRYISVAYPMAGLGILLLLDRGGWRRRLTDISQYFLIGFTPLIAWFIWLNGQKNAPRLFHISSQIWSDLEPLRRDVIEITWSWIPFADKLAPLSYNNQKLILLIILLLLFVSPIFLMKTKDTKGYQEMRGVILGVTFEVFIVAYLASLAFAYVLTTPQPDIDQRILLPVRIAGMVLVFVLFSSTINIWSHLRALKYLQLLPLIYLITYLSSSIGILSDYHQTGHGYTSKHWRESPTVKAVQDLPPEVALISNEAAILLFYTGRPTYEIPELIYTEHPLDFSYYGENPNDQAQRLFIENKAVLVLFDNILSQFQSLDYINAQERLDAFLQRMYVFADYADGTIYFHEPTIP